jgi:hypothetical protein
MAKMTETQLKQIKDVLGEDEYNKLNIPDEIIDTVYNLLINNIIPVITSDDKNDISFFLARYYYIKQDNDNMEKYYLMSIEHKNIQAMVNLGFYYKRHKNYTDMEKYYLMAIEYKSAWGMNNLGFYYHEQKDYEQMKKYYLMAIDEKDHTAMYNLGFYYSEKKEYEQMKKYYIMASENHPVALVSLFNHYYSSYNEDDGLIVLHNLHKKGIPNAYTNFLKLLKVANDTAISSYCEYMKNIDLESDKQKAEITNLKSYITELEFAPDGPKYKETKDHFESISNTKI